MWMEKTKNGKYKFCERYVDPITLKYKRVSIVMSKCTRSAKKEAQELLAEKINKALDESPASKCKNVKLGQLINLYIADRESVLKASTILNLKYSTTQLSNIIGPDVLVTNLSAGYVRQCILSSNGLTAQRMDYMIHLFKTILTWGYQNDYVDSIEYLSKLRSIPWRSEKEDIREKYLEPDELKTLIAAMDSRPDYQLLTLFLVLTGLRFGEAAALTVSDIDLKERLIHVTKNYDAANDVTTSPKTACSVRDIYIQDELMPICRKILRRKAHTPVISIEYRDLIFLNKHGRRIKYQTYFIYLQKLSERVINRRITPHILRHTHASLLAAEGVSIDDISLRLGHENDSITRRIYTHVTKKARDSQNERIRHIHIL